MYLLIDNYDSFTYNLYHFLGELGAEVKVVRNDQIRIQDALDLKPKGLILSPGPRTPNEAGICLELVRTAAKQKIPLLGVCLGHQCIGQAFGGKIVRANRLMHGKVDNIAYEAKGLFHDFHERMSVTRYHSLVVEKSSLPSCFDIRATSDKGQVIQAMDHKTLPIYGLQFHPESIATTNGKRLLNNFLENCS